MNRFLDGINLSLATSNWYSALALALTLPDICGALETPDEKNGVRYRRWFSKWMEHKYMFGHGVALLSAKDCYLLRCSYLHAGSGEVRRNSVQAALERFHFIEPPKNGSIVHLNSKDGVMQLQVDVFCREMMNGVKTWELSAVDDFEVQGRMQELLKIHDFVPWIGY